MSGVDPCATELQHPHSTETMSVPTLSPNLDLTPATEARECIADDNIDQLASLALDSFSYNCANKGCHKYGKLARCAGCKVPYYCGRECQLVHWKKTHKQECAAYSAPVAADGQEALLANTKTWMTLVEGLMAHLDKSVMECEPREMPQLFSIQQGKSPTQAEVAHVQINSIEQVVNLLAGHDKKHVEDLTHHLRPRDAGVKGTPVVVMVNRANITVTMRVLV